MFFDHIPHLRYIWLVAASTIAGVMNAMAGGGSFLSFPAMLGMGVLPVQANATNTVALWPGQLTSLATLRGDVRKDLLPAVAATCIVGGVLGAEVLLHTKQRTFMNLIPWLILGGTLIFGVSGPVSKWMRRRAKQDEAEPHIPRLALAAALFPVCFYIGYFGAGGGFLVMTILALFGMEKMHTLNAMKVFAALLSNFVAIITFIFQGAIVWHYCVVSMVFAAFGGWVGARFARRVNGDVLRAIVVATGCVIAAYFFWRQAQG
ncbi:MAG: sulfite exporter TauE/SafE family protein [Acidobacteria bacterium]|nr:sulfite exporter TauE/SafE family protein [Acidobacteriota bacterium]